MICDHLAYNINYELESNYEYRDSEMHGLIEYHLYRCRYCGQLKLEPENFAITVIGFLPRVLSCLFNLLKKMTVFLLKKNDLS